MKKALLAGTRFFHARADNRFFPGPVPAWPSRPRRRLTRRFTRWRRGAKTDKVVVVSDVHLGVDDTYAETVKNRQIFVDFLHHVAATGDIAELVIAGRLF